jgi:hypothetical protein
MCIRGGGAWREVTSFWRRDTYEVSNLRYDENVKSTTRGW